MLIPNGDTEHAVQSICQTIDSPFFITMNDHLRVRVIRTEYMPSDEELLTERPMVVNLTIEHNLY